MEKELSTSESLAIITNMIAKAKNEVGGDGSFNLLLWGWVISLCNIAFYVLAKMGYEHPYYVWVLVIPASIASVVWGMKQRKNPLVKSHLGNVIGQIWLGIFIAILITLAFMPVLNFNQNPVILLFAAVGMFVTGSLIKVKIVKFGALTLAFGAIVAFLVPNNEQYLVSGIAMILGYLVPGYYLKKTYRERV